MPHDRPLTRSNLDSLDHELISILRIDGRASLAKIAASLGVSRGTVQNRLDRLIESGALLGFTVRIKDDIASDSIRALMMIEIEGRSTDQIIRKLRGTVEVHALHSTNGNWDLIAEIQTSSLTDFDRVLRDVRMIEGVLNSETNLLLSSL